MPAKSSKPTLKQRLALTAYLRNGGHMTKAMEEAGYSPTTAKSPGTKLTQKPGFIALCEEMGLTDSLLVKALVQDIKKKAGNRRAELELGFKVKGHLRENEPVGNTYNTLNVFTAEQTKRIAEGVLDGNSTIETEFD